MTYDTPAEEGSRAVGGWTWEWEYPGVLAWYHAELPNGFMAATPFWGDDHSVQVEWQTIDGDVYPLEGFEFSLTGDPVADAVKYVEGLLPLFEKAKKEF